jgi:HAD superfamily hydrolase (TIGR01509 family)
MKGILPLAGTAKWREISAVLFDLDGVLVDSQRVELEALRIFACEMGASALPEALVSGLAGLRMQKAIDVVADTGGFRPPADSVRWVREIAERLLAGRLRPVRGVRQMLKTIRQPKYVVSNSPLAMVCDRLMASGLADFFEAYFSAYEIGFWKPDSRLYLHALSSLELPADRAVAVEDSLAGVRSAAGAGLLVYWYGGDPLAVTRPLGRVECFSEMSELPARLEARTASSVVLAAKAVGRPPGRS